MKWNMLKVMIEGTEFVLNKKQRCLQELYNLANSIDFDELKDEGDFFSTLYDTNTKNLAEGWFEFGKEGPNIKRIIFPAIMFDERIENDEMLIREINKVSEKRNWGIELSGIYMETRKRNSQENKTRKRIR